MTSVVSWLPVNAARVYGRGCFYVVLHNTEISTQHGIWGRKGDKIERGRLKIQILSDGIFPRGHESHLQWCRWEKSYDKQHFIHQWQLLCFPEKNSAFCWSLSKTEGERREEKNNNNQLSFWFTYFFLGGAVVRKLSFSPDLKRKAFSKWQMQTSTTTVCSALGKLEVNFQLLTGKRLVSKIPLSLNIILQKYLLGCKRRTLC